MRFSLFLASLVSLFLLGCVVGHDPSGGPYAYDSSNQYQPAGQPAAGSQQPAPVPASSDPSGPPAPPSGPPAPPSGPVAGGSGGGGQTPLIPPPLPRVLVSLKGNKGDFFASYVEEVFLEAGFKLYDRNQLHVIRLVDAALSTNDLNKLRALKLRYGIEVIVRGRIVAEPKGIRRVYGRTMRFYSYRVSLRAIKVDTGELIYSRPARTFESSSDRRVIQKIKNLADLFAEKLRQYWAKERYREQALDVVISRIDYKHLAQLEEYVRKQPKVASFARRNYAKKTAFWNVDFRGNRREFENILLQCPYFALRIVRTTAHRIEAEFVGQRARPSGPSVSMEVYVDGEVDKPGTRVWVNGKEVPVRNGKWRTKIDISRVKKLVIIARDPYGNETREERILGGR